MSARRRFKEWEVVATLIHQGLVVTCFRCKQPFEPPTASNQIQREHLHEIGLGGPDEPAGCRYSHYDCHSKITNGNGATTANSSKGKIAKAKRLEGARLALEEAELTTFEARSSAPKSKLGPWTPRRAKPVSRFPKGRKLQSRPFQKPGGKHA